MRLTSRYEENDVNLTVHQIKRTICHIMNYMVKLRESSRISYMLLQYKLEALKIAKDIASGSTPFGKHAHKVVPMKGENDIGHLVDAIDYAQRPMLWVEYLLQHNKLNFEGQGMDLSLILLDLSLYNYDELVNMSFEFIHSQFTQNVSVLRALREV